MTADRLTPEHSALILLAAGRSSRFGASDKLAAPFMGRPLALHAVVALESIAFGQRIAVCRPDNRVDFATHGFAIVTNAQPEDGVSSSIRLGVRAAREGGATAVVIALADMPRITAAQVRRLFDAATDADTVVASSDGVTPKPPALFGAGHFAFLEALEGDEGARPLILAGRRVITSPAELVDIDTEQDAEALQGSFVGL